MGLTRRLSGILACILLAHLSWSATGYACALRLTVTGAKAAATTDMLAEMTGMNMSGAMGPCGGTQTPQEMPGHAPAMPDDCPAMAPCAALVIAPQDGPARDVAGTVFAVAARSVVTPSSIELPPELPPPRA